MKVSKIGRYKLLTRKAGFAAKLPPISRPGIFVNLTSGPRNENYIKDISVQAL